jgi:hypothetical protein
MSNQSLIVGGLGFRHCKFGHDSRRFGALGSERSLQRFNVVWNKITSKVHDEIESQIASVCAGGCPTVASRTHFAEEMLERLRKGFPRRLKIAAQIEFSLLM